MLTCQAEGKEKKTKIRIMDAVKEDMMMMREGKS